MKILIAGASGFIGHELIYVLKKEHDITALGRNQETLRRNFLDQEKITLCTWDKLDQLNAKSFDAVINLSGHNIAASRWTPSIKQQIIESRVQTTQTLINWIIKHQAKPHLLCANAVGIYGVQKKDDLTSFDEDSPINLDPPSDFLSEIGLQWQAALQPAIDYGIPVTSTRFGVVLKKGQGMLKKLFPSFYFGLGGIIGDGQQLISWVHIDDVVDSIIFLLQRPNLTGAFNLTSPYPVNQAQFTHEFAACLHRPQFLKLPASIIHLLFGEMGELLLLQGQRVLPKRLLQSGYIFKYPKLNEALEHEFK